MYSGGNNRRFEPTVSLTLKDGPTSSSSCAQWFRKYRKYILVSLVTGMILFLSLTLGLTLTNATIITSNTPKITTTTMSNTNTVTPTTMPSNTATTTTSTTATTKTTITPGRKRTKFRIQSFPHWWIFLVPGVLITGGRPSSSVGVKVEAFNVHTKNSCHLADLPDVTYSHSLCGRLLCGGRADSSFRPSCLMLNPLTGDFTPTSVRLQRGRYEHLCWDVEGENGPTLIIGGYNGPRSSEFVSSDSSSSSISFTLTYDTR